MGTSLVLAVFAAMLTQETTATLDQPKQEAKAEVASTFDFEAKLKSHVSHLAETIGARNLQRHQQLETAANFIESEFKSYQYATSRQTFQVKGLDCHNIVAEVKGSTDPKEIVIIGCLLYTSPSPRD